MHKPFSGTLKIPPPPSTHSSNGSSLHFSTLACCLQWNGIFYRTLLFRQRTNKMYRESNFFQCRTSNQAQSSKILVAHGHSVFQSNKKSQVKQQQSLQICALALCPVTLKKKLAPPPLTRPHLFAAPLPPSQLFSGTVLKPSPVVSSSSFWTRRMKRHFYDVRPPPLSPQPQVHRQFYLGFVHKWRHGRRGVRVNFCDNRTKAWRHLWTTP